MTIYKPNKDCKHFSECCFLKELTVCPNNCVHFRHKDEVRVVRCKDCVQWERFKSPAICHIGRCHTHDIEMGEDEFCSFGEKQEVNYEV
jgi:hypothetical protein